MSKKWYVVHAFSGFEKRVVESLHEHIERAGMQDMFGEILVPTEDVVELDRGGKKRTTERKFFPGYVLVEMEMNDDTWHLVKNVPKVSGFIGGTANRPTPITQKEVNEIVGRMQDISDKTKPKFSFVSGEVVRVIDGPFRDFNGTVEDDNYETNKFRVAVSIWGLA